MGHYEIAADVPGRLRLRIHSDATGAAALADVANAMGLTDGVRAVRVSSSTGSLVISYDPETIGVRDLVSQLAGLGYAEGAHDPIGRRALARPTRRVVGAFESTSRHMRQLEGPGVVVPVALGVLSARQLVWNGLQLDKAPWYTFAWYAYSLYRSRQGVPTA